MRKHNNLLPLSAALASLAGTAMPADASVMTNATESDKPVSRATEATKTPNAFLRIGDDLLGFITTTQADGTVVVAGHTSHASHASHSSHASHASSRY